MESVINEKHCPLLFIIIIVTFYCYHCSHRIVIVVGPLYVYNIVATCSTYNAAMHTMIMRT